MELDPRYAVPGRASIDKEMTKILIELKGKVAEKLKDSRLYSPLTSLKLENCNCYMM